jgi:hypothetical protein
VGRLIDYVRELREHGIQRFRERHDHPFLVRAESWEDDVAGFHTAVSSRDEMLKQKSLAETASHPAAKGETIAPGAPDAAEADGLGIGTVYAVTKRAGGVFADRIGLGRARSVDVCVFLGKVSKYHAYISKTEDGFEITDAGSKNGTNVAGKKLVPKQPAKLLNGVDIELGPYHFTFYTAAGFLEVVQSRLRN